MHRKQLPYQLGWYQKNYYRPEQAALMYRSILLENSWLEESINIFGRKVTVPRLVAWQGECGLNYRYSGRDHIANGFDGDVLAIRNRLEQDTQSEFNFVLLNLYRDGHDYMGFHADNEPSMQRTPAIASVSFGIPRRFVFRNQAQEKKFEMQLESGSLLWMTPQLNAAWKHAWPKQRTVRAPRLNLTFRQLS